jgi:hypothetical protein
MKASLITLAAAFALLLATRSALAQCCPIYIPRAPDAYGPCYYYLNEEGLRYGPT